LNIICVTYFYFVTSSVAVFEATTGRINVYDKNHDWKPETKERTKWKYL